MGLLLRIVVNALALGAATWLLEGITVTAPTSAERVLTMLGVALVFGLVNAFVRPVVKLLSLPFIILTLGLLLVVINAAMLLLAARIAEGVGLGFRIEGFWTAVLGAIIVSVVSAVLGWLIPEDE